MPLTQSLAYSAPSMVLAFLFSPIGILQGIYAKHFGIALTTIATVLLISRLFDAITDPLVGYFSDRHYARSGSRKPAVITGGLLFVVSSYFLYVPVDPLDLTATTVISTSYFLGWFLIFYFAWTLMEIPHLAWGAELAHSAKDKNKLYSLRTLATLLGVMFFYLVPLLPFSETNEFTPTTLQWAAIAAGLMMFPALYFCVKLAPNGARVHVDNIKKDSLWELQREIIANKPFLIFISSFCLFGIGGTGMFFTLMFVFVDSYLNLGEYFAQVTLLALVASMAFLSFWCWLANGLGKKLAWGAGVFMYVVGVLSAGIMEPSQAGFWPLFIMMALTYTGSTAFIALSPSLLGDIIDYSTWRSGADRTATYFSLYTFSLKTSIAIGGSVGLGIAGWYGFDPATSAHTQDSIYGLRLAACWLPAFFLLLSILVMAFMPINTRHHNIIRQRLDAKIARADAQASYHFIQHSSEQSMYQSLKPLVSQNNAK